MWFRKKMKKWVMWLGGFVTRLGPTLKDLFVLILRWLLGKGNVIQIVMCSLLTWPNMWLWDVVSIRMNLSRIGSWSMKCRNLTPILLVKSRKIWVNHLLLISLKCSLWISLNLALNFLLNRIPRYRGSTTNKTLRWLDDIKNWKIIKVINRIYYYNN